MKKPEKLKLDDLRESFFLIDVKESNKIKGGDGIPYDEFIMQLEGGCWGGGFVEGIGYVASGVTITGQAPGYITSICDLQNQAANWSNLSEISSFLNWITTGSGVGTSLYSIGGSISAGFLSATLAIGSWISTLISLESGSNAANWQNALLQLAEMGYTCSSGSSVRIDFNCNPYYPNVCTIRIWDPTNGYLLNEFMTY